MRFFSGVRGGSGDGKTKITASQRFKEAQNKGPKLEKTKDEIYKEKIAAKMQKMMEDAMMGKKKGGGFKMPGTKEDDKPRELSKNAKVMMKLMAMQKLQKDAKKDKKKLKELMWKVKAEKRAKALAKATEEADIEYRKKMEEDAVTAAAMAAAEAANSSSSSSWWGVGPSSDDSGW